MKVTVKELISGNHCSFSSFRAGHLYYHIDYTAPDNVTVTTYQFTIPIEDTNGATFNAREKAITLMRWINKAFKAGELIFVSQRTLQND